MDGEHKVIKKKLKALYRKNKRALKDKEYMDLALSNDIHSISWGRRKYKGRIHTCEMGYGSCESRGYCNGDC